MDAQPNKKTSKTVQLTLLLHGANFTHQRMQIVAKQKDRELREQFVVDVSKCDCHMLVFDD